MTSLKAELPDHLYWLTEKVEGLVRPGAFLSVDRKRIAPVGGTFVNGRPDVPMGASWASVAPSWDNSPRDGESFWLQLNLEDIPAEVRKPEWPTHGVVWLTLDLSDRWRAEAYHDPRPASSIPWQPRGPSGVPNAMTITLADTMTGATDGTLPEISKDYHRGVGMACDFDEWAQDHYLARSPSDIQLGGWIWPSQADFDEANKTLVMEFSRQEFGDSGSVELHFEAARGFFASVHTC